MRKQQPLKWLLAMLFLPFTLVAVTVLYFTHTHRKDRVDYHLYDCWWDAIKYNWDL